MGPFPCRRRSHPKGEGPREPDHTESEEWRRPGLALVEREATVNVAVVGTGHVGLVTGIALATVGHRVVATDVDHEKIALLQSGLPPFYEPGWRRP